MTTPESINKALASLDVSNDNHWTADGAPRLETVRLLAGDQSISREAVTTAAPGFSRASAVQAVPPAPVAAPAAAANTPPAPPAAAATPDPVVPAAPSAPAQETKVVETPAPVVTPASSSGLPSAEVLNNPNPAAAAPAVSNIELLKQKTEQLAELEERIADVKRAKEHIEREYADFQTQADALRLDIDKLTPVNDNQNAIQQYLASQRKILEARAGQLARVRQVEAELGVKLADLTPKPSALDRAMARRTGHGLNRPK